MVLGKLPVPGRPTILITVGQGPNALAVGAGGGGLDIFALIYPFSSPSPALLKTARYRLKYCLKGPVNSKQSTNQNRTPQPKAPEELIEWERSVAICPSSVGSSFNSSKHFSSKTTAHILVKFHNQSTGPIGTKTCSNDLGPMTNMTALPIYGLHKDHKALNCSSE